MAISVGGIRSHYPARATIDTNGHVVSKNSVSEVSLADLTDSV
jgi:hypothetical protein